MNEYENLIDQILKEVAVQRSVIGHYNTFLTIPTGEWVIR